LLATIVLTHSPTSHAQPLAKRVPRLGVLLPGVPATYSPRTAALQQALRELGYVEGKTLTIEWRWAEDRVERLPELAVG
jgi:putative tryptophan/tyrosine transport system substrate-binding protein